MTDDTAVRELMRTYTDGEPPLGFGIDDVHRAASGGGSGSLPGSAPRRRWVAPLVAAAACTALVAGGVALATTHQDVGVPQSAGGGDGPVTPTPEPSVTPTAIPTVTHSAPADTPVTGAQMPDLLRSIATSTTGPGSKELRLFADRWTFDRTTADGTSEVPLSRADEATHFAGTWTFDGGARRLGVSSELLPTDVDPSARDELEGDCRTGRATADACGQWTLADGSTVRERYADRTSLASDARVEHTLSVRTATRWVTVSESRLTTKAPADITRGWSLGNDTLQKVLEDKRLRFRAPDPLPALPSLEFCRTQTTTTPPSCIPAANAG